MQCTAPGLGFACQMHCHRCDAHFTHKQGDTDGIAFATQQERQQERRGRPPLIGVGAASQALTLTNGCSAVASESMLCLCQSLSAGYVGPD